MNQSPAVPARTISAPELTLLFTAFIASAYGFGIYLFASLVAEMRGDLGLDYADVGLATGTAQAGFLAASLLSGIWAPRLGPVRVILGAVAATALSLLLMTRLPATHPPLLLIGLLTIMGAGAAAVWVPMVAIAQDVIPTRHRAKALGLISSGTAYGVFLNGLLIPPLVTGYGWRGVWLTMGCIAVLLLIIGCWRLRGLRPATIAGESLQAPVGGRDWKVLTHPVALLLVATMFLTGLTCAPFQTYLVPLLREDLGMPVAFATRIWTIIGAVGMIGGFLLGLLADRISIKWAMVLTYTLLSMAPLLLLGLIQLEWPAVLPLSLVGVVFALAFNAVFGLVPAYMSTMFTGSSATLLFGLGNIALGLGGLLGNVMGGFVKEVTGNFTFVYVVAAIAALLQIALALATPNERTGKVNRPDRS
jgi:predicted MFS family arabinose efflux permease